MKLFLIGALLLLLTTVAAAQTGEITNDSTIRPATAGNQILSNVGDGVINAKGTVDNAEVYATRKFNDVPEMRTLTSPRPGLQYWLSQSPMQGWFEYDPTDSTTADDGIMTIVTSNNKRLKRVLNERISVKIFGAKGDGLNDDTQAIKNAVAYINKLTAKPSLYMPTGNYKISSEISLPWGINITGDYPTISVTHTTGSALRLLGRHNIEQLRFSYPNQDMTGQNLIAYPAAITCNSTSGYSTIRDIGLGNAYIGIDFSAGITKTLVENIYGYPLYRGIIVNKTLDVLSIKNVHFNPNYFGTPAIALRRWVFLNATAIELGRVDWATVDNCFAFGYNRFIFLTSSPTGGSANDIRVVNWAADACNQPIYVGNHDGGITFDNGILTSFYPYTDDTTPPSLSLQAIYITGGGSGTFSSKMVRFTNNRFYRADKHLLLAYNPILFTGNEIQNYAYSYTDSSTAVIDAIQLNSGSDNSIITNNIIQGKNKAQNRCIAIINSDGHVITNNIYQGWKAADVYVPSTVKTSRIPDKKYLFSYDPPALLPNTQISTALTVPAAVLGDVVSVTFSLDLQAVSVNAYVSAAGTVTALFKNGTSNPIDLAQGNIKINLVKSQ